MKLDEVEPRAFHGRHKKHDSPEPKTQKLDGSRTQNVFLNSFIGLGPTYYVCTDCNQDSEAEEGKLAFVPTYGHSCSEGTYLR